MKIWARSTRSGYPNIVSLIQFATALDIKNYLPHGSQKKYMPCMSDGYWLLKGLLSRLKHNFSYKTLAKFPISFWGRFLRKALIMRFLALRLILLFVLPMARTHLAQYCWCKPAQRQWGWPNTVGSIGAVNATHVSVFPIAVLFSFRFSHLEMSSFRTLRGK